MCELSLEDKNKRFMQQAKWTKPFREFLITRRLKNRKLKILEIGCGTGAVISEMITDYKSLEGSIVSCLSSDELKRKGFDVKQLKSEDLSWIPNKTDRLLAQMSEGFVYTLDNGQRACITPIGIFLENGTKFAQKHAMEIRRYDEKTNELLISGNEFNNMSELRIPTELLQFCETASLPGTPGVDKTPDPGIKD